MYMFSWLIWHNQHDLFTNIICFTATVTPELHQSAMEGHLLNQFLNRWDQEHLYNLPTFTFILQYIYQISVDL